MNTFTETCPSLEDLAAFLDGGLSRDERARIVAHLADCPACYEIFTEAARSMLSDERGEKRGADPPGPVEVPQELVAAQSQAPGEVVPFPRRPIFRWVSSIAAVLAVSLATIPFYRQYYTMPQISSAQLVSPAVSRKAPEDQFWSDLASRGNAPVSSGFAVPHEILLGAHAFDLHLSLGRNDSEQALDDLAGINTHIEGIGFLPDQAEAYKEIQKQIYEGQPASRFIQKADELEANLPVEEPYVALGKWLEAGRLAALAQSPDFFQAPENRKFLRAFLHHEVMDLDTDVARTLGDIKEILDSTAPSSLPYKKLQQQFESILKHYQEESLNSP